MRVNYRILSIDRVDRIQKLSGAYDIALIAAPETMVGMDWPVDQPVRRIAARVTAMPALLMRISTGPSAAAAGKGFAHGVSLTNVDLHHMTVASDRTICDRRSFPWSMFRPASATLQPARLRVREEWRPKPLNAPAAIAVLPRRSSNKFCCGRTSVT
jgi:hypothetical protein